MKSRPNLDLGFFYWVIIIAAIVLLIAIFFSWGKHRGYFSFFSKISAEVMFTFITTVLISLLKYYTSIAESNTIANAKAIKLLENRIDSALIQISDLRNVEISDNDRINQVSEKIDNLHNVVTQHRLQLLQERLDLTQLFYGEVCEIHKHITYRTPIDSTNKLNERINKDASEIETL